MKLTTLIISGLLITIGNVFAQKGVEDGSRYGHGQDSINCLSNSTLYYENYKNKDYKSAYPYWIKVFDECPTSSSAVYSAGAIIVQHMIDDESNPVKKEEYYQLLMKVYDQRMKYYGNSRKYPVSYIQGIKAVSILKYKRDEIPAMKEAQDLFAKAIEKRGDDAQNAVITTYFTNTIALFKVDELSAEDVVNVYTTLSDILEEKTKEDPDNEELQMITSGIEKLFADSGAANCDKIQEVFGAKFDENSTNVDWLKRVNRILNQQLCENELTFKVAESLHKLEPSASSARGMAVKCLKSKDFDGAVKYYNEAIKLETNKMDKGSYNYELGLIYISQNKYPEARVYLLKASELRPDWGLPYMQIGLIYGLAAPNCGENEFEHKCAYWAAVDKFIKAKTVDPSVTEEANKHIKTFSAYFPNTEELFFYQSKIGNVGDSYKVGCWINETTTIRAKQ